MKSTVFRYGLYSVLAIVALSAIEMFVIEPNTNTSISEISGYLIMLISMIFVFIGIKYYRDKENKGMLTFGQGLKVGLLIVLIPSVAFGLFDLLYTKVINPGWMDNYYTKMVEKIKKTTAPEKLDAALQKLQANKELFSNPVMEFLLMALTVFIIGFIVTIISSLALRRSKTAIA